MNNIELLRMIVNLRQEVDWIKSELSRIKRDRPRPQDQSPYDLNRHQLKPMKRIKRYGSR